MEMSPNVSISELAEAISAQLVAQWEAWKNQDAALLFVLLSVAPDARYPSCPAMRSSAHESFRCTDCLSHLCDHCPGLWIPNRIS